MTLNNYITHPIGAGPKGLAAHMGVPLGWGMSLSPGLAVFFYSTTSHSYCQKSKMVTAIICLTKNMYIYKLYRFTHYFHLPHPVPLNHDLPPPPLGGMMPHCHLPPLPD